LRKRLLKRYLNDSAMLASNGEARGDEEKKEEEDAHDDEMDEDNNNESTTESSIRRHLSLMSGSKDKFCREKRGGELYELQCKLNNLGASDLVVDMLMKNDLSDRLFKEAVLFAIALLEGGNSQVQVGRRIECRMLIYFLTKMYF
jgi:hypothetical protein